MIDLHLHTTASDGRLAPDDLVDRVADAGVAVMAVTDHDTTAAWPRVSARASARGIRAIPGIEITAVESHRDVHMLGYFIDVANAVLIEFLREQRRIRIARLHAIGERLAALGMPLDVEALIAEAKGKSVGRPVLADALIAAGHAVDRREVFDRWLGNDGPAFVPREGVAPETVTEIVHAAGGVISLAHPGRTKLSDDRIRRLAAAGLDAIEVYHSDHDASLVEHYGALARELDLLVTGGSDYHGDPASPVTPAAATLPAAEWARLAARA